MQLWNNIPPKIKSELSKQRHWLVTGGCGFIGGHIVEFLLEHGQRVTVIDSCLKEEQKKRMSDYLALTCKYPELNFFFIHLGREGVLDIGAFSNLEIKSPKIDIILHQAAQGSVPRSIAEPTDYIESNINGFFWVLELARRTSATLVYASSSSVYGVDTEEKRQETWPCLPKSPYGATKLVNEVMAAAWERAYGIRTVGLRYFNVYGPRQSEIGDYAAVIPKWCNQVKNKQTLIINGSNQTSRDFTWVGDVVQANILAAFKQSEPILNISSGMVLSLGALAYRIFNIAGRLVKVEKGPARPGDVKSAPADISLAISTLGYKPEGGLDTLTYTIGALLK